MTKAQYRQTRRVIANLRTAMNALQARVEPINPLLWDAIRSNYLAKIAQLEVELSAYKP